jgi:hypothetical protein
MKPLWGGGGDTRNMVLKILGTRQHGLGQAGLRGAQLASVSIPDVESPAMPGISQDFRYELTAGTRRPIFPRVGAVVHARPRSRRPRLASRGSPIACRSRRFPPCRRGCHYPRSLLGRGGHLCAVAALQRSYFTPPDDHRAAWDISQEPRTSKLTNAPPIEHGRDLRFTRSFRTVR